MKKFRWQLLIILVTGFIVGILLILQQVNNEMDVSTEPSPVSGGVYTEALIGEFMRLNPFLDLYNPPDHDVDQLIFNGLIRFDSRGIPQTDLAESWGVSGDGTVYNFSLRDDVYWHDGELFTSADIAYSVGLLQSEHGLIPQDLRDFWAEVELVVLSESQIQFLLPEPFAPFLDYLKFGVLPEHILGGLGMEEIIDHPFNLAPVGTGPFKFQRLLIENDAIVGVVLEAFEPYFLERPFLDEFIFRYYPSGAQALAAYRNGDVEGIGEVQKDILPEVLAEPGLSIYTAREPMLAMVYLNLNNAEVPFLQNPDFRRALLASIDRELIIKNEYNGQAIVANGPILPGTWAYYDDIEPVPYDPVTAQNLLAASGATWDEENGYFVSENGIELALTLFHPDTERHTAIAQQIREDWNALGIGVTLQGMPYPDVIGNLELRSYQAALVDIDLSRSPDPDPYPFWGQAQIKTGQNYADWDNRSESEFLEQARMTVDFGERERLYRNFQVLFNRELPSLPLIYPVYTYAASADLNGIKFGPLFEPGDRFNNVHDWFILSSRETKPTDEALIETEPTKVDE